MQSPLVKLLNDQLCGAYKEGKQISRHHVLLNGMTVGDYCLYRLRVERQRRHEEGERYKEIKDAEKKDIAREI